MEGNFSEGIRLLQYNIYNFSWSHLTFLSNPTELTKILFVGDNANKVCKCERVDRPSFGETLYFSSHTRPVTGERSNRWCKTKNSSYPDNNIQVIGPLKIEFSRNWRISPLSHDNAMSNLSFLFFVAKSSEVLVYWGGLLFPTGS